MPVGTRDKRGDVAEERRAGSDHGEVVGARLEKRVLCVAGTQMRVIEVDDQLAGFPVARGVFGAFMKVSLVNDGPATFVVEIPPGSPGA